MTKDIPALAYIEQQVLGRAARSGSLGAAARVVETDYGMEAGSLGVGLVRATRVLSLMYCLVLYPKEFHRFDRGDPIFRKIEDSWSLRGVEVLTPDPKFTNSPCYGFVRRLRNAVAHANISFTETGVEFWDRHKGRDVYRARMSFEAIEGFLETVGALMANERNRTVH